MPQFPVFTVCVDHVERCHFNRAHSFSAMTKTGYTLETVMSTVLVFLNKIITEAASVFSSPRKLAILNRETLRVLA